MNEPTPRRRRRARRDIDDDDGPVTTVANTPPEHEMHAHPAAPEREPMRQEMRGETAREEAERVGREILDRNAGKDPDFHDDFQLPIGVNEPDGWTYQWKRRLAGGAEDPGYQRSLMNAGWRCVPASRHPEMVPMSGGPYEIIEQKGLVLMEIPKIVDEHMRVLEKRKAMERLAINANRLGASNVPGFERMGKQVGQAPVVNRTYDPLVAKKVAIPVPQE